MINNRVRKVFVTFLSIGTIVRPSITTAQDSNCVALLQHGIYDYVRQVSGATSSAQYKYDLCQAYSRLKSDQQAAKVEGHYGLAGGEGDYSASQLDNIGQSMCTSTASSTFSQTDLNNMQQFIDPAGADAYKECVRLNSAGLKSNTVIRETDAGQMTLDLWYVAPVGAQSIATVKKVAISPTNSFTCSGPLWDMQSNGKMDTHSYGMSCARAIKAAEAGKELAPAATVTVLTDVGSVTRSFAPLVAAPPPPPFDVPVGSIIAFSGTTADAEKQTTNGWWICDGRTVSDSRASIFNGKPTPNLKDQFLRGSTTAEQTGGAASYRIPDQVVHSHTNGQFGVPTIHSDPFTHMQGPHTWSDDAAIYSEGTWSGSDVPTVPPFHSVIYLIRVR
jgi:hypothetical protein